MRQAGIVLYKAMKGAWMSDDRLISYANLAAIESGLKNINRRLDKVDSQVSTVNGNVAVVRSQVDTVQAQLTQLQGELDQFRKTEQRHHNLQSANENLVRVNQDLQKQFGHYDEVRRTTTGILQATDIGLVHSQKITDVVEDAQLKCPGYWLAPCLVATAAWINDDQETAQKAIIEGIKRNDEKTSLYFGLVDRRSQRNEASTRWMQRYLVHEDPSRLHRSTIVVIDAYSAGLFPAESKDLIGDEFSLWLDYLENQDGFHQKQVNRWMRRFQTYGKRPEVQVDSDAYPYLREYSPTWPQLEQVLEGARQHHVVAQDFQTLFETPIDQQAALKELDRALNELVTNYDDEELPLREEKQMYEAVIRHDGDEDAALDDLQAQDSLDKVQDFGQLLATASTGETGVTRSLATQKYAIAMSRDWALEAYRKLVAQNRRNVPVFIQLKIDDYTGQSIDGSDVETHVQKISAMVDKQLQDQLAKLVMTEDDQKSLQRGYVLLVVAGVSLLLLAAAGLAPLGVIVAIICAISGYGKIKSYKNKEQGLGPRRNEAAKKAEEKKDACVKITRATCAEIVDFRREYGKWDADAKQVTDFLDALDPQNYVRAVAGSARMLLNAKQPSNEHRDHQKTEPTGPATTSLPSVSTSGKSKE